MSIPNGWPMKLYYGPGACSLASDIVIRELGLNAEFVRVITKDHMTEHGDDFYAINPKGYVPTLVLDSGEMITENPVVLTYLGEQKPAGGLVPAYGTPERRRLDEWLTYIGTELHKNYSPLFNPSISDDAKQMAFGRLEKRIGFLNDSLKGREYLLGDAFSVADAYAFAVLRWSPRVGFDLALFWEIQAYMERILTRPATKAAMEFEGLS